jgi:hypothetical protein
MAYWSCSTATAAPSAAKSVTITLMLAVAFVRWWYGTGWRQVVARVRLRIKRTADSFSIQTIARTLFAPWKRIITRPGAGIDAHLRAIGDNAVSRAVGFVVRITVLFTAGLCLLAVMVAGLIQIVLWPLVPLAAIGLILKGLTL